MGKLAKNRKGIVSLIPLIFSPFGIAILIILAIVIFGLLGFGIFLTINLFTIAGVILIVAGLIAVIKGAVNTPVLVMVILGFVLLALPKLIGGLSKISLAAFLG